MSIISAREFQVKYFQLFLNLVADGGNYLRYTTWQPYQEEVSNLELVTSIPIIYDVDMVGNTTNKVILN